MAHDHWKELFPPHIWKRGLNYYRDGRVLDLYYRGNTVSAEIEGTDVYTVSVTLDPRTERIEDHSCDCPYGEDGTPCKHLAALLFALEDDSCMESAQDVNHEPEIEQIVSLLSEQQMRELLVQFARNDSYIREKIQLAALRALPQAQKSQWRLDLDRLAETAAGRHGFIHYDEAYNYCCSLQEYLDDRLPDLLANGLTHDAFELTCLVFQTGMAQDMDDSDGGLSMLAESCMVAWSEILEAADLNTHKEMFLWFTAHYSDDDLIQMFLEEYIFTAPWKPELAPELVHFLDQQIPRYTADRRSEYHLNDLIIHRIRWMEQSGANKQEVDRYMSEYHHLSAVRDMQISRAMLSCDYDAALALLEESTELDQDKLGLVAKYSARKIEIFELTNRVSALKEELTHYVFTFRQDDLIYTEKLKALLTPSEWKKTREQLLNSTTMLSQVFSLLEREGLHEQLMERIEKHSDIYALERYESLLKKEYALRCRSVYIVHLMQAMSRASKRTAYRSVIQTLKKLRKYPDGKAVAQEIAENWKREYPRRSSMLDELRKAGF